MRNNTNSEGKKNKPRGRPFAKGNVKGKTRGGFLDASGPESSFKQTTMKEEEFSENFETALDADKDETSSTLIDSIVFTKGENTLKLNLIKKGNRAYRMQIFLNDVQEVRPVTYNGASTALSFWNLLKGSMK